MRIAISGAHGVGKTTLIRALGNSVPGVHIVGNVMRTLSSQGVPIASQSTPDTMVRYLEVQLSQEREPSDCKVLCSDRILADGVAYVRASARLGVATYPWTAGELSLLAAAARLHASTFDFHIRIPIEFDLHTGDPHHSHGREFQRAVDLELANLIDERWPTRVLEISGNERDRLAALLRVIDLR